MAIKFENRTLFEAYYESSCNENGITYVSESSFFSSISNFLKTLKDNIIKLIREALKLIRDTFNKLTGRSRDIGHYENQPEPEKKSGSTNVFKVTDDEYFDNNREDVKIHDCIVIDDQLEVAVNSLDMFFEDVEENIEFIADGNEYIQDISEEEYNNMMATFKRRDTFVGGSVAMTTILKLAKNIFEDAEKSLDNLTIDKVTKKYENNEYKEKILAYVSGIGDKYLKPLVEVVNEMLRFIKAIYKAIR